MHDGSKKLAPINCNFPLSNSHGVGVVVVEDVVLVVVVVSVATHSFLGFSFFFLHFARVDFGSLSANPTLQDNSYLPFLFGPSIVPLGNEQPLGCGVVVTDVDVVVVVVVVDVVELVDTLSVGPLSDVVLELLVDVVDIVVLVVLVVVEVVVVAARSHDNGGFNFPFLH